MADELNLSLPERKTKPSERQRVILLLLALLLLVALANVLVSSRGGRTGSRRGLDPASEKQLALKLEKQGLRAAAAEVWTDYLQHAHAPAAESAKVWYRVGRLYQEEGRYAEALTSFYRSESFAKLDELAPEIARRTQECLEAMGKFAALRYELAERVGMESSQSPPGEQVVAEIGPQKITKAELDRKTEQMIERQIAQFAAYLPPDEASKQKQALLKRFASSPERLRLLNQFIVEELLYRKARQTRLVDDPQTRELLRDAERKILAQRVLEKELADQIKMTHTDLQTYYEAHSKDYIQSERAQVSHILVDSQQAAQDALKRLQAGEKFEDLAKELSRDEATKDKGGQIDGWIDKTGPIPGIGRSDDAAAAIFSTEPGNTADSAVQTDKGWHVLHVRAREPERQKAFDEVRPEVFRALRAQKEREVQANLLESLKKQYNVVVHHDAFAPQKASDDEAGKTDEGNDD